MVRADRGRLLVGLILVLLGVLLIFERAGLIGDFNVWSLWPLFIVAVGFSILSSSDRGNLGGWIVIGVGVVLLVQSLDVFSFNLWSVFGAIVLVAIGLSIILRRDLPIPGGERHESESGIRGAPNLDDVISVTTLFNERRIVSTATAFRGGSLTLIFGDVDLDLRRAQLSPAGAVLNVTTIFGDMDIDVPPGWAVHIDGTTILGDVKDRTTPVTDPAGPRLVIRATTIFGDIEVDQFG